MNENKDKETQQQAPKTNAGDNAVKSSNVKPAAVKASGWKRWLGKKWVFPATYMAAAAIILAIMWVIQDSGKNDLNTEDLAENTTAQNEQAETNPEAVPVGVSAEELQWPVDRSEVEVSMPFYDSSASNEDKQAAIVEQGNKFTPNMGVALSRKDDKPFDVLAAMSGEVTRVDNVPSVGKLVEITHDGGLVTIYYSLSEISVSKGDEVNQGDVIAKAGRNEIEKGLGVHLHFEVHKNGEPVNPVTVIAEHAESSTSTSSQAEQSEQTEQTEQTEPAGQTEQSEQTEATEQSENAEQTKE